jgi:1-deoxy-D-xylulose-5-phosphate synthase
MTPPTILGRIDRPQDLHALSEEELAQVAQEVRAHIIDTVGEIGGHFGANLGTCELAVALHSLLDSPRDKVVWDVGHQAYPHKVLTGRRDQLPTIRQYEGLAPFCAIHESEHDIMGAGHASTAIGYAVGLKEGMRLRGDLDAGKVVAVVGDGAMTGGVAFEAIHQAGGLGTPIVVVLNDNGMSIAPNVGAMSRYFNRVRLNPKLWHAREGVEERLADLPGIGGAFERLGPQLKESIKAFWAPGLWWEELDWAYVGVVDGHDVRALRAGRGRRARRHGEVARRQAELDRQRRAGTREARPGEAGAAAVHGGVRRGDDRRGPPRPARRRHHGGDELGHGAEPAAEGRARPLLRRRYR